MIPQWSLPQPVLLSLADHCSDPCYCGVLGTEAECPPNPSLDTLSGSSSDLGAALAEVGGLDLQLTQLRSQPRIELPAVLSQVDGTRACAGVVRPTMAITFSVLRRRIGMRSRHPSVLSERLHLPVGTRIGLVLFASDADLEDLWTRRIGWVERIVQLRPSFVVAPDFSVWAGDHALATRYNIVRSLRFMDLLQSRGLTVVPHFYWANDRDLADIASWLQSNHPEAFAIDLQCLTGRVSAFLAELTWLREQITAPAHLLASGWDVGPRLERLRRVWPNLSTTRNYVPEVAKHVAVTRTANGRLYRQQVDELPRVLLERRLAMAETWMNNPLADATAS